MKLLRLITLATIFTTTILSAYTHRAMAQQYGNEWIDFTKVYWKLKVAHEGIYRISKTNLDAIGLPTSALGSEFVLWRNGKEVALFVSNNGTLSSSDYIEFWGKGNDGQLDKELYLAPNKHNNEYSSLFNDTAIYFLTLDNSTSHLRYNAVSTTIPSTPPSALGYCYTSIINNGRNEIAKGKSVGRFTSTGISELYSSQFENGEGYIFNWNPSASPANLTIHTPNIIPNVAHARLKTASVANARDSAHKLKVFWNNTLQADSSYGINDVQHFDLSIPGSLLSTSNSLKLEHRLTGLADVFGVPYWSIEYPRDWNFSGLQYAHVTINPSTSAQYIEISNFNHGGTAPKLYDLSNNKWYLGDIGIATKTRFYIDASLAPSDLVLFAISSSKIINITSAQQVTFTNFSSLSNQGDYVIITHKNLMKPLSGKNQIEEYKNYRNSVAGGSYKALAVDVKELYDQFAYGTYTHPLAISRFIDYGINNWLVKPEFFFLIGKAVSYDRYKEFRASTIFNTFEGYVPTYGFPGSDNAFVTKQNTWKQKANIGRLSAWNTKEVADYLNKVKAYEIAIKPAAFPSPRTEIWKKQVLHLSGGDGGDLNLQANILLPALNNIKSIIENPSTGAIVHTYAKNTKGFPTVLEDKKVDSLISSGLSLITFYGHATSGSFDYNLKEPSTYNSLPKLPILNAFGCDISAIFKVNINKTVTEEYVKAPNSGAIASIGSNNQGYTNMHSAFMPIWYSKISASNYGQSIASQLRAAQDSFIFRYGPKTPFQTSFEQTHMESLILQGDPAIQGAFNESKPDYYVGAEEIISIPSAINTSLDSFQLKINAFNLGKIVNDSIQVKIEHINPAGISNTLRTYHINNLKTISSNTFWINIDKTKDIGVNKYRVIIDYDNRYDEVSEANNTAILDVIILSDNVVPIYPYNFSIVHNPDLTLKASTLNPFKGTSKYRIEIDTTELFNSAAKISTIIEGRGGVIKWKPSLSLQDSVVYYWRTSLDSSVGGQYIWANSSFIYLKNGSDGWNQSHYFQYKYNALDSLIYSASRKFEYLKSTVVIRNMNFIMELPGPDYSNNGDVNNVKWSGIDIQRNSCFPSGSLQVFVFDSSTGRPWNDKPGGTQGSVGPCFGGRNFQGFTFPINTANDRNNARKFLDSIPKGNYIFIKNHINHVYWGNFYTAIWKNDTLLYGSGKSLYHSMLNLGFNTIDSFNRKRLFSFFCKKGFTDYPIQQDWSDSVNQKVDISYSFPITDVQGKMNSVVVGPASTWKNLKWRSSSYWDTATRADTSSIKITGITNTGVETPIYEGPTRDTNLGFINAQNYPKLKLQWRSKDSLFHTAPQLDYWRVLYDPLPEAALNPAALYSFTDSVSIGQLMNLETAIETLTDLPMDSMLVRYKVIDANGVHHLLANKKYRKLNGNDSLQTKISFDPKPYPGKNYLFIEANPDNNQPEQYHPNNLGYVAFDVTRDQYAPLMDVTFDGVHILDRDIISSKPLIKIMLRDENKFLALKDTNSMKLFLKYIDDPSALKERIPFDGTVCRFIAADMSSGKNEAFVEYRPTFTKDGMYQLYAEGTDIAGNEAGQGNQYSISFEVVGKSTITNLLNYPNPFSTSTAFVFTLTGSQIPSQFKIQILSITGKVVREITKQELGPIRIGRNITEYKWDGKDQYGQVLGNGVYLYRVVTSINGEDLERRANSGIDKFNKNGYTKMYIMR
jgi:hypothetical protein